MTTREVAFATGYMNTQEFKAIQVPLKAKHRENPESAVITLHAEAAGSILAALSSKQACTKQLVRTDRKPAQATCSCKLSLPARE
jgi:hypothetical protein